MNISASRFAAPKHIWMVDHLGIGTLLVSVLTTAVLYRPCVGDSNRRTLFVKLGILNDPV